MIMGCETIYVVNEKGERKMSLTSIIGKIPNAEGTIKLLEERPKAVSRIDSEPFYVEPLFKELKWNASASIILFSAPGAVGKSALAKYISYQKGSIYWDLSQVKLGQHSLNGMLIESLGAESYSFFAAGLKTGKQSIVIDALDEADLISGRKAIEMLLDDIKKAVGSVSSPCIALFSRGETAIFVGKYLSEIGINYGAYEIGFFTENNARVFIKRTIETVYETTYTPAMKDCVDAEFKIVSDVLEEGSRDSFLGYAPVLQTVAKTLIDTPNTMVLKNSLHGANSGIEIVNRILAEGLLKREQSKIINGMKENLGDKYSGFNDWDKLYTLDEQIVNITIYILMGEVMDDSDVKDNLEPEMYEEYIKSVMSMTCQHPFLGKSNDTMDFVGPAFRDFSLAILLGIKDKYSYVSDYKSWHKGAFIPSQLLFDFYCLSYDKCNSPEAFRYVYDAFLAKETSNIIPYVSIVDGTDNNAVALFTVKKDKEIIQENELELKFETKQLIFRQMINTSIDCDYNVIIGCDNNINTRIVRSSVICKNIQWASNSVMLEECTHIIADNALNGNGVSPDFDIRGCEPKISLGNVQEYYKLRKYAFVYSENTLDAFAVHNSLKKLFSCMRGHRKDTPARDKEFVDFVVMGHSELRKKLLNWLLDKGIIYIDSEESHLYKMDLDKASSYGINWNQLCSDDVESEKAVYEDFSKYY